MLFRSDWQKAVLPVADSQSTTITSPNENYSIPKVLTLQHLHRLLRQPVDVFIRDRLRIQLDKPDEASVQEEPFALDHLEKYRLTQTIAYATDPHRTLAHLRLGGELAIAGFGQAQAEMLAEKSHELLERFSEITKDWPTPLSMQAKQWSFDQHDLHAQWGNSAQNLWRTHTSSNEWLQIELRPGSVVEGKEIGRAHV